MYICNFIFCLNRLRGFVINASEFRFYSTSSLSASEIDSAGNDTFDAFGPVRLHKTT